MNRTTRIAAAAGSLLLSRALGAAAETFPVNNPAFYGAAVGIDTLFNTQVGGPNALSTSYRFRSDHSGTLKSFRWFSKTGSGYSAGTGGTIRVQLQTDDGASAHLPSGTTLATVSIVNPSFGFPLMTFPAPAQLQAGQLYHLVFTNVDPNPASNYVSVNAVNIQRPGSWVQPGIKDADYAQLLRYGTNPWSVRAGFTPILELDYGDGYSTGAGYMESWVASAKPISGSQSVRQTMTVLGSNRSVYRVTIRLVRASGSDPLTVRLEKGDGTSIEQGTIPAASIPTGYPGWVSYAFASTRTLSQGQSYNLVLTAPPSSSYSIYPIRQGAQYGFTGSVFKDGYADFNPGSGWYGGWNPWGSRNTSGVLQFYFDAGAGAPPPDGTPPAVSLAAPSAQATVSSTVAVSANASDNVGVAGVQFLLDGAPLGAEDLSAPYSIPWDSAGTSDGGHVLSAVARDAAGNRTTSAGVTVTVANNPVPPGCVSVPAGTWRNAPLPSQAGAFSLEFDATPSAAALDGVVGLSSGGASAYSSLAAVVRFNNAGRIDALDGGAYAAASPIPYAAATAYHFRLVVDLAARTYSAYVRQGSSPEATIGRNYAFRTAQSAVGSLDNLGAYAAAGSELVCNPAVSAGDTTAPAVAIAGPASGALVAGTISLSATASDDVGVAGVRFELDGAQLGAEDTAAPFALSWDSRLAADGPHGLTAVARDAAGNTSTSAAVAVTVDNAAPVISGAAAGQISSTSAVLSWTTDEPADSQAEYGTTASYGASALSATPVGSHSLAVSGLSAGTLYHVRVRSKDAAGNAAASPDFTFTTASPPAPAPGCVSVGAVWQHLPFSPQSGSFGAEFDATPKAAAMDGVMGLSNGPASGYSSLAAAVRFNTSGRIDARNGGAYAAAASIPYVAGASYHFRLEVNLAAHAYSAYVRPPGSAEQLLGADYAFRTEQASVATLSNLSSVASSGGESLCSLAVSAPAPDATPPAVSLTAPSAGATVSSTVIVSASASDDTGVAGVQFLLDGAPLGAEDLSAPYTIAWNSAGAPDGGHVLSAVARDAAGNRTTSAAVSVTVANAPAPAPPVCVSVGAAWQVLPFSPRSGSFEAEFDATPAAAAMDGVMGLSNEPASDLSGLAAVVRFNASGKIDARNGGAYAAAASIPYSAGRTYHFRLQVDLAARTYNAYVRRPGAREHLIGADYAFRTEQASVSTLSNLSLVASSGRESICSLALSASVQDGAPPASQPPPSDGSPAGAMSQEFRAPQRYLSPAIADGVNDKAVFGPKALEVLVFDASGRRVFQATRGAAASIVWDCRDASGRLVDSGIYVVRIRKDDGQTAYQSLAVVK